MLIVRIILLSYSVLRPQAVRPCCNREHHIKLDNVTVTIPQAVRMRCNPARRCNQFRQAGVSIPQAVFCVTILQLRIEDQKMRVTIPQAVRLCCNQDVPCITYKINGLQYRKRQGLVATIGTGPSGVFSELQYRKRYGFDATTYLETFFNCNCNYTAFPVLSSNRNSFHKSLDF